MGKTKNINMRMDGDLIKEVKKVMGYDNLTAITVQAYQELIMNHKTKKELLLEEEKNLMERLSLCREEMKELEISDLVEKTEEKPVYLNHVEDRLEKVWEKMLPSLNEFGLESALRDPGFLIKWTPIVKATNQNELKDIVRRRYSRK